LLTIQGFTFGSEPIRISPQSSPFVPIVLPGRRNSDPCVPKCTIASAWKPSSSQKYVAR
jgi:hypothetical protein